MVEYRSDLIDRDEAVIAIDALAVPVGADELKAAHNEGVRKAQAVVECLSLAWRPIETAPKDGMPIWLANAHQVDLSYWDSESKKEGGQCWRAYSLDIDRFDLIGDGPPTHWKPFVLPSPPAETAQERLAT